MASVADVSAPDDSTSVNETYPHVYLTPTISKETSIELANNASTPLLSDPTVMMNNGSSPAPRLTRQQSSNLLDQIRQQSLSALQTTWPSSSPHQTTLPSSSPRQTTSASSKQSTGKVRPRQQTTQVSSSSSLHSATTSSPGSENDGHSTLEAARPVTVGGGKTNKRPVTSSDTQTASLNKKQKTSKPSQQSSSSKQSQSQSGGKDRRQLNKASKPVTESTRPSEAGDEHSQSEEEAEDDEVTNTNTPTTQQRQAQPTGEGKSGRDIIKASKTLRGDEPTEAVGDEGDDDESEDEQPTTPTPVEPPQTATKPRQPTPVKAAVVGGKKPRPQHMMRISGKVKANTPEQSKVANKDKDEDESKTSDTANTPSSSTTPSRPQQTPRQEDEDENKQHSNNQPPQKNQKRGPKTRPPTSSAQQATATSKPQKGRNKRKTPEPSLQNVVTNEELEKKDDDESNENRARNNNLPQQTTSSSTSSTRGTQRDGKTNKRIRQDSATSSQQQATSSSSTTSGAAVPITSQQTDLNDVEEENKEYIKRTRGRQKKQRSSSDQQAATTNPAQPSQKADSNDEEKNDVEEHSNNQLPRKRGRPRKHPSTSSDQAATTKKRKIQDEKKDDEHHDSPPIPRRNTPRSKLNHAGKTVEITIVKKKPDGGHQLVKQDVIDVECIRRLFNERSRPKCFDDDDESMLCSFKNLTEQERKQLQSDGCLITPLQYNSIQYSAAVKSKPLEYNIKEYGDMLIKALQEGNAVNYEKYPNISRDRIELKLHNIESIYVDNNVIFLELFMSIESDRIGQYHESSEPGLLVSFQRKKEWSLRCIRISDILNGLQHNPTLQSKLIENLQKKYDNDCKLQQNSPQKLSYRLVPVMMNNCINNLSNITIDGVKSPSCSGDGFVVCAVHGQCLCVNCYSMNDNDLKKRVLPQPNKKCTCDPTLSYFEPQYRMNLAHFCFLEEKEIQSPIQQSFERLRHYMICPGYKCYDTKTLSTKNINTATKRIGTSDAVLSHIVRCTTNMFSPNDKSNVTKRNWISFLGHAEPPNGGSLPHLWFNGETVKFKLQSLLHTINENIIPLFKRKLLADDELLFTFMSCFLTDVKWFLDIPNCKNQFVIFLRSQTNDYFDYAKFPILIREFWQDRKQSIIEAFENTMRFCSAPMVLISYVDESTRKVTTALQGHFRYEIYSRKGENDWDTRLQKIVPYWIQSPSIIQNQQINQNQQTSHNQHNSHNQQNNQQHEMQHDSSLAAIDQQAPSLHSIKMIESQSREICRHFLAGKCHRPTSCKFKHVASIPHPRSLSHKHHKPSTPVVCRFYLSNACTRNPCKYSHDPLLKPQIQM